MGHAVIPLAQHLCGAFMNRENMGAGATAPRSSLEALLSPSLGSGCQLPRVNGIPRVKAIPLGTCVFPEFGVSTLSAIAHVIPRHCPGSGKHGWIGHGAGPAQGVGINRRESLDDDGFVGHEAPDDVEPRVPVEI